MFTTTVDNTQIITVAGFVALLVTATIAASYNLQTAKAAANPAPYGKTFIAPAAQTGIFGSQVSTAAHLNGGLSDFRANGCKLPNPPCS